MGEVKLLTNEEITQAVRDKGGCFAFAKYALSEIEALRNPWCEIVTGKLAV